MLAQQKMEQLRGLTWGFDTHRPAAVRYDERHSPSCPSCRGGTGLTPSPRVARSAALSTATCDYLDARGNRSAAARIRRPARSYIRRWSIEPLPTNPNNTLILQVLVTRSRSRGVADTEEADAGPRLPDEARIISVKTRKAS